MFDLLSDQHDVSPLLHAFTLREGESLDSAQRRYISANPVYKQSAPLDTLRRREFKRLRTCRAYLDYTGAGLYPESLVKDHANLLSKNLFGNPHSTSPRFEELLLVVVDFGRSTHPFFVPVLTLRVALSSRRITLRLLGRLCLISSAQMQQSTTSCLPRTPVLLSDLWENPTPSNLPLAARLRAWCSPSMPTTRSTGFENSLMRREHLCTTFLWTASTWA